MVDDYDDVDGHEYVKILHGSSPFLEDKLGQKIEKDSERMICTLAHYLKMIDMPVYIEQPSQRTFNIFTYDNKGNRQELFYCDIQIDQTISEDTVRSIQQERQDIMKIKDASEVVNYLMLNCRNVKNYNNYVNRNFSIRDWMVEQKLKPYEILYRRILQIVSYCRYCGINDIRSDPTLVLYITDYMQMMLRKNLRNPDCMDYLTLLKIPMHITRDKYTNFKYILKQVLDDIKAKRHLSQMRIDKFQMEYDLMENCMIDSVNKRIQVGKPNGDKNE